MDTRFTNRSVDIKTIDEIKGRTITWNDGWSFAGFPEGVLEQLKVGGAYVVETRNFSQVTGMANFYLDNSQHTVITDWFWHKTDEDLDREHQEMLDRWQQDKRDILESNREDWTRREAALPQPLRDRLQRFRDNGYDFDVEGWGYELVVCELAVLYSQSGQEDDSTIDAYGEENGTSGNQHDYAKALSRLLTGLPEDDAEIANSVSALAPLTGSSDYSR